MTEIERLRAAIAKYDEAARKFILKVERGQAHSRETYRDLKDAYAASQLAQVGELTKGA